MNELAADNSRRRVSRFFGRRIIKQQFQFKFALVIFSFLGFAALVIWLEGHFMVNRMIQSGLITDETAIVNLKILNSTIGQTSVLALFVVFGLSLFFSYFVAGPIYRFEKTLEALRDGDLTVRVNLRKYDEFKEVAILFNQALTSLRNRIKKDREGLGVSLGHLSDLADKLSKEGRSADGKEIKEILSNIKNTSPQVKI